MRMRREPGALQGRSIVSRCCQNQAHVPQAPHNHQALQLLGLSAGVYSVLSALMRAWPVSLHTWQAGRVRELAPEVTQLMEGRILVGKISKVRLI